MFTWTSVWYNISSTGAAWLLVVKWERYGINVTESRDCVVSTALSYSGASEFNSEPLSRSQIKCDSSFVRKLVISLASWQQIPVYSTLLSLFLSINHVFSRRSLLDTAQNYLSVKMLQAVHLSRLHNCSWCNLYCGMSGSTLCLKFG
jgi:hypothetical protein